jgi:cytochrome c553
MKREFHPFRVAAGLCCLGLIFMAGITLAASRYADLRRLEPVHGDPAAGAQKVTACFACHGANGAPIAPTFPRLAGQRLDYLYHRLVSFRHGDPKDPYYGKSPMTPLAANLSDTDMRDMAAYFAQQSPQVANAVPILPGAQEGASLFLHGDPARGVPPCQGCHGPDANGPLTRSGQLAAYPSLRGQSGPYLVSRLTSFRDGLPTDTSNAFIMAGIAHTLDDQSIQALGAYLSSLTPVTSQ